MAGKESPGLDGGPLRSLFDLGGKTALVTGGSGTGGFAMARGLAAFGANVALVGRTPSALEAAAADLADSGARVLWVAADCRTEEGCRQALGETLDRFGGIDILVAAASACRRFPAEGFPMDVYRDMMDTNVQGTFLINKLAGEQMIRSGGGKIINISSVRAVKGHSLGYSAYAAGKAAVQALSRQLAVEWAGYGVCVNCIATTELAAGETAALSIRQETAGRFPSRIPLGRVARPEDLVGAAVYLASAASDFVTGQTIFVDGGSTAC